MKQITVDELAALEAQSHAFARRHDGPKAFLHPSGLVYKLVDSRWHWRPSGPQRKAFRFRHNAKRLAARGIPCPEVVELLELTGKGQHVIVYRLLPGEAVRDALPAARNPELIRRDLAAFLARLHGAGVFFRAGHLGNYLIQPDGAMALIDLQDLWISVFSLGTVHRVRAFRILMKYAGDRERLGGDAQLGAFTAEYLAHARLNALQRWVFWALIPIYVPALRNPSIARRAPHRSDLR